MSNSLFRAGEATKAGFPETLPGNEAGRWVTRHGQHQADHLSNIRVTQTSFLCFLGSEARTASSLASLTVGLALETSL
jgi:hypothetical protein